MKKLGWVAILSLGVLLSAPVLAQTAGAGTKASQTQQKNVDVAEFDKQAAQIQENFKKMQQQMDQIRATQDPQERQKLMQAHWSTMQGNMNMMQGMWGSGMMGCCGGNGGMMGGHMMGWNGMGPYYSKLTPEQLKQRQYMMDQYMGMQQNMMNQMMQQNYICGWIGQGGNWLEDELLNLSTKVCFGSIRSKLIEFTQMTQIGQKQSQ